MMYGLARPWLFRRDAEEAHRLVMERLGRWRALRGLARWLLTVEDPRLRVRLFGREFANPVGLAAGLDKHAEAVDAWPDLGFGYVEIGTVTPRPQEGNPKPRLFRLVADLAIINRMGFNSDGAEAVRERLLALGTRRVPVGVNVGRNRDTPNEAAEEDYRAAIGALRQVADYFVINVSSPNTVGLRALQNPSSVGALVAAAVAAAGGVPVLIKLAPDLEADALAETAAAALEGGAAGFVAANTTIGREGLAPSPATAEAGGLSGAPLRALATETVRRLYRATRGRVPILGVGGIFTAADAYEKIRAGASLVQVYTGLIYEGPGMVRRINRGLLRLLARDGLPDLTAAIGLDAKDGNGS
ncbi:MAG: quinone-dependent dihydroorotate dehydrogenase [Myxococcales bacterium]|nr:quinone-dependent dihydroorotate dehydrogenase [Myxococcales bacterium]